MLKNTAGQLWQVFAFAEGTGAPVEDDEENITATIKIGPAAPVATDYVNPTQAVGKGGYYLFGLSKAETNANQIWLYPVSSTPGVTVIGVPGVESPSVNVATVAPYSSRTRKIQLTKGADYKTNTPPGPLLIPITANNVTVGDVVRFGAELCSDSTFERIYIEGEVVSSSGQLYASFEIEGSTDLDKTPSPLWRWGLEHVNEDEDVSAIASDLEMELLPDRVVG